VQVLLVLLRQVQDVLKDPQAQQMQVELELGFHTGPSTKETFNPYLKPRAYLTI
jgi:hypothetical protein